jgi:NADH dehydrogenase
MKLVVGATGLLGGLIVKQLLARGKPVRAMIRQPSVSLGSESVIGDLKDPESLDRACRGVTTVITTANSAQRGGADNVTSVDLEGNRALIRAAANAGVRHFVFVSAAFVDPKSPNPLFAAKARTEEFLRESALAWTIVAPHAFLDVWFSLLVGSALRAGVPVSLVNGGQKRHSFVAVDDVAAFTTGVVDAPAAIGRRLLLGGPDALSFSDIVAKASEILNAPVPVKNIQPGEPISSLLPPLDHMVGGLAAGLELQDVVIDATEVSSLFGITLTPAEAVLRRALASRMA